MITTTTLLTYFPALAGIGLIAGFWSQSKNFILKIFRIFWKNRVITYEFQEPFYKELYRKSFVINFDDYDLLCFDLFSVNDKQHLPVFLKGYRSEIFLYKGFIPIFLFGAENSSLKIQYLKFTFNFEKFLTKVTKTVHVERKDKYLEKESQVNNFYIQEVRGKSMKSKMIDEQNQLGSTPKYNASSEPSTQKDASYTLSPEQSFRQNFNRLIGFDKKSFAWYSPSENLKNKYQFTKQGKYILEQVEKWLKSQKWCDERNIPHRRGAILYSKPGEGKSSLILEIAKILKIPIYYFDITEMNNEEFSKEIGKLPSYPAILLFEDFDNCFDKRESKNKSSQYATLTFDYLINKISGIKSIKGKFIFVTTNDIAKIDDALLRAGRLDYKIELKGLDIEEKLQMAKTTLDDKKELVDKAMENSEHLTTAEFEGKIIQIALDNYYETNIHP